MEKARSILDLYVINDQKIVWRQFRYGKLDTYESCGGNLKMN